MILFLFLPLELLLGPDHDLKSYSAILHFQTTKSHNFPIIRNQYYSFFLYWSIQGPTTQVELLANGTLNSNSTSPTQELLQKQVLLFQGWVNSTSTSKHAFQGPPRPSQGHQHTLIIDSRKWPPRTPKRNLLRSWYWGTIDSTSKFLHAHVGDEPEANPVWLLTLATSAAQWQLA